MPMVAAMFGDDISAFGCQTAVRFDRQLLESDDPAWQFSEFFYGNFTFLHRFIECDVSIESDSEKLKIGSSGVFESPVKTLRRCGIWKM